MLCREQEELSQKDELSVGDLDLAHKLTDTVKNIDKIEMLEGDDTATAVQAAGKFVAPTADTTTVATAIPYADVGISPAQILDPTQFFLCMRVGVRRFRPV